MSRGFVSSVPVAKRGEYAWICADTSGIQALLAASACARPGNRRRHAQLGVRVVEKSRVRRQSI